MQKKEPNFAVNHKSNVLKFQQLVEAIIDSISRDELNPGEMLPSVNQLMKESKLSRDTVFKAYNELKSRGIVESVPNRGYFVTKGINRVFLFLDTFKAYKEVLFGSFRESLARNVSVDLHFHHYNIKVFESLINDSLGKFSKYVVMNFDHPKIPGIIQKIPPEKLLIIDWNIHASEQHSFVAQDFEEPVYRILAENLEKIRRYREFIYLYPSFTYHPKVSIDAFRRFCSSFGIKNRVIFDLNEFKVRRGDLCFLVSDRTLARFLDQCEANGFEPGREAGVISYNETPMKKYVKNGITVISTDFEMMGQKAAEFVNTGNPVKMIIPTNLKKRSSF